MEKNNSSDWKFIIVNTLFWLILGGLLLSDENRLIVGGSILAILVGGGIIYLGLRESGGLTQAGFVLTLSLVMGFISVLIGSGMLIRYFTSEDRLGIRGRIARVANHKTTILDLSGRKLTALDPKILELSTLTVLNLENNRLTELPPEIGQLVNLESLNLEHNQLTELPREIGQLTNLRILWLDDNYLTHIPPEIGNLRKLESLTLNGNQLTHLPAEIGQLSKLQYLGLLRNQLTALPGELGQLSSLTTLYLDDNQLTELPPELEQLTRLQVLSLNRNPLGELPADFMEQAQSEGLQISYNQNAEMPPQLNAGLVYPAIIIAIIIVTFALDRGFDRLEKRLKINASGKVYAIPGFARTACILALLLIMIVDVVLFIASLNPEGTGIAVAAGIGVPLLLSPLMVICLYMLSHNSGVVVLTKDAITLRHVWDEKQLLYHEITSVKESSLGLPPNMVIKGAHTTLRIPRSVENLPELYRAIMQKSAAKPGAPTFPYRLALTKTAWAFGIGGGCLLVMLYLGIGLAGFWVPYIQAQPPAYDFALFLFAGISIFFLPGIFIFASGTLSAQQPIEMILSNEIIRFRLPGKSWQTLPVEQMSAIELEPVKVPISLTNSPVRIWSEATAYRIILKFSTQHLIIGQDRAKQFGCQPEQLYGVFQQLYR
ncbi:MAG: leucine-rich repeat domain-containing protein [Anaerolineae bacterium]|nr:leucine-rich repeat domain-containing protein [Anaerolineae bacterium]